MFLFSLPVLASTDTTNSLAFKKNKPKRPGILFYQPDLSYQILQQFRLLKEANAGDPLAQHELGLRYLVGEGMPADTNEAAIWIRKAAEQKLTSAQYNYGILLINGWGVNWDPFEAYKNFLAAAEDGMPIAQYIIGLLHTDNLIVKKDLESAWLWLRKAYAAGYEPAFEVMKEIEKKISVEIIDTTRTILSEKDVESELPKNNPVKNSMGLVFIDFDAVSDTIPHIDDDILISDLLNAGNEMLADTLGIRSKDDSLRTPDAGRMKVLQTFSDYGSPEAITLMGRLYEKGKFLSKNRITAALHYLRAIRYDSQRAAVLLYHMSDANDFRDELLDAVGANNPDAMFVLYGLHAFGYDNSIASRDAINLLINAAANGHVYALTELGINYYTGRMVEQNIERAFLNWKTAIRFGSEEAKLRLAAAYVFDRLQIEEPMKIKETIEGATEYGSLLAQVLKAHMYEKGILVEKHNATSVKYYRFAAQRGNRFAYEELKRLYNEIRPDNREFYIGR